MSGKAKQSLADESISMMCGRLRQFVRRDYGGEDALEIIRQKASDAGLCITDDVARFIFEYTDEVLEGVRKRQASRLAEIQRRVEGE